MTENKEIQLVYITTDDPEEARNIGRVLVEERLAACANILDPMTSIFRWEGKIQEGAETVLILKTKASLVDALSTRVTALHSYDRPCVVGFAVAGGDEAFLEWVRAETV